MIRVHSTGQSGFAPVMSSSRRALALYVANAGSIPSSPKVTKLWTMGHIWPAEKFTGSARCFCCHCLQLCPVGITAKTQQLVTAASHWPRSLGTRMAMEQAHTQAPGRAASAHPGECAAAFGELRDVACLQGWGTNPQGQQLQDFRHTFLQITASTQAITQETKQ